MIKLDGSSVCSKNGEAEVDLFRKPYYVLITAARNEAANIELTIKSVISQTHLPLRWVIVSDGSTDGTDQIVKDYCRGYDWIELIRRPERSERHFAAKAEAFNLGYVYLKELPYQFIGNLDADVSFEKDFFAFLIKKFEENPRLGIGGAPFQEGGSIYDYRFSSIEHVSGACQLFRRECFEDIGGYVPLRGGGIDVVAVLTARMRGWQTRTFTDKHYVHHKKEGTAKHSVPQARFMDGQKDYALGAHPAWMIFRSFYQMTRTPIIIGGTALLAGYLSSMIKRTQRDIPKELICYRRRDQLLRLNAFFKSLCLFRRPLS